MTSGSACLMSVRIRASVLPRQSASSAIRVSMFCVASLMGSVHLLNADQIAGGITQRAVANSVRLIRRLLNHLALAVVQQVCSRSNVASRSLVARSRVP